MSLVTAESPSQLVKGAHKAPNPRTTTNRRRAILPLLLVVCGVLVLLYPVVATYVTNRGQSVVSQYYTDEMNSQFTDEEIEQMISAANSYNDGIDGGPILDPWLARVREDNPAYTRYLEQLNLADAMGRVIIPSIRSDLPIYHGTTEDVLEKGIGHLFGTSLPVGGARTHAVLTGHTGLTKATMWDNLRDVKAGDAIFVQVGKKKLKYQVHNTEVVAPGETKGLAPVVGEDLLTLITCTPYGINSHRLLVHAHRVEYTPEDNEIFSRPLSPWQEWMTWVVVFIALVLALVLAGTLTRCRARRQAHELQHASMERM